MTAQQSLYKIIISGRQYKSWTFLNIETDEPKLLNESEIIINPVHLKMFSGDIIDLSSPIPTIVDSPTKTSQIPGVLIIEGNQTYGRTNNQKRLLYKCIPNDPRLPSFLIPFSPTISFLKTQKNRYVVFRFDNWNSKYPQGILMENLGEVGTLSIFYEYQLFCRNLSHKITDFTNAAKKTIKMMPELKASNPHFFLKLPSDTRRSKIFSIDPAGTVDFDDALSISIDSPFVATICVHIANVFAWMETLNLWSAFGERVSTIYLPDFKRPMIPSILSDSVFSLIAYGSNRKDSGSFTFPKSMESSHDSNKVKLTFCMELKIDLNLAQIVPGSIQFYNRAVKIDKNYVYESPDLLADYDYHLLQQCTRLLDKNVNDSHDIVAYWMIQMNSICGKWMHDKGVGIFRQVLTNREEDPDPPLSIHINTKNLLYNWKNTTGKYLIYNSAKPIEHKTMQTESYVHITSPIRRLVDLLNQIIFQKEFGMVERISESAQDFLNMWQSKLNQINESMQSTRKIQIDCDLLYRCNAHPEWMQHLHRGIIFDRIEKKDGLYSYMVHLSELNILGKVVTQEKYVNYQSLKFRLFFFQDAEKLHRKIRLAIE